VSTWLVVWFVIAIVATIAVLAFLIALIRHLLVLGRTARRLQDEVSPIVQEISAEGGRASARASHIAPPR
jgi:hypothetical protein